MKKEPFDVVVEKVEKHSETMISTAFGISVAFSLLIFGIMFYEIFK